LEVRAKELRDRIRDRMDEVGILTSHFWQHGRAHAAVYEEGMARMLSNYRRSADVQAWLAESTPAGVEVDAVLVQLLEDRLTVLDEVVAGWRAALGD
jgi:hypothetical protein